ncbi:hypothetical protein [Piscirickettsia salmonis]|nr:hypothetical protein [Piscirickettsia salmonis]QHS34084.1 hypothetical protein GW535_12170 [Piscirickettsia salmonis]QIX56922.1 hypothetical protein GW536_04785 [Piscirickettsia salmonis]QNR81960.1 hypothetical protein ICC15_04790 [Piscirickettsia salmonis]WGZ73055.1 hypothetical protein E3220_09385 [Piscirickettsia salmonis EM-90]
MAKNDVGEEVKDREEGVGKLGKKGFASSVDKHDTIQQAVAKVKQHKDITGAEGEAEVRQKETEAALDASSGQAPVGGTGPNPALQQFALLFQQQQQQAAPTQPEQQQQMGL